MNDRMILAAEKAYRKFEEKASEIAKDVKSRLEGFDCEVSCDIYKGDGLCACFENLEYYLDNEGGYNLDDFVVSVKSIPKRGKIDINFVLKNSF